MRNNAEPVSYDDYILGSKERGKACLTLYIHTHIVNTLKCALNDISCIV